MSEAAISHPVPNAADEVSSPRADGTKARRRFRHVLWAPFWLGSEVPLFTSGRQERPARDLGPAGAVVLHGLDQTANRLWLRHALHTVMRAVWLILVVGCLWLVVDIAGGPAFEPAGLLWVGVPLLSLAAVYAALNRPGRFQTARMLDRSFGLHDRLSTALDHLGRSVPREGERASVVYLQMADAANVLTEVRRHRALKFQLPVRELVPALGFALLLAALFFVRGAGADIPPLSAASVPKFTPAVERQAAAEPMALAPQNTELAPTVEEVMERSRRSNLAQRDLQHLANALADHAVTSGAAEAIRRGEFELAANELRDFAPQADQLSPAAGEAMARDLEAAASRMSPENTDLRGATDEAASGLREGGETAQAGVEELGDAVQRTGEQVSSQQELADQMQQAQETQRRQAAAMGGRSDPSGQSGQADQSDALGMRDGNDPAGGDQPRGDQPGQSGSMADDFQPGPADTGSGAAAGEPGMYPGEAAFGEGSEIWAPADQPGAAGDGQAGDGADASQGGGAGGESGDAEGSQEGASSAGTEPGRGDGEVEQQVGAGDGRRVRAANPEGAAGELRLPSAPGGEGVQTVNNAGGMVRGSGAGITAGSGTTSQAEVGEAGPDSNRVPDPYRPVVERYFSDLDD